jgi:hypothetical protein
MTDRELPPVQPGQFTISWMIAARSGVRWPGPVSPAVVQGGGTHPTAADVLGLEEMLRLAVVKVTELSAASPAMVREAASVDTSSVWNCM